MKNASDLQNKLGDQPFTKRPDQFGFVVPDLHQAIKDWLDQGVGPWFTLGPGRVDTEYLGNSSCPKLILAYCQVGAVQLELIQPLDGEATSYRDFLAAGRSGFQHCGFYIEPHEYERSIAQATASGAKVQQTLSFSGAHFAYFVMAAPIGSPMDRVQLGDVGLGKASAVRNSVTAGYEIGELIEFKTEIRALFAKVTEAATTWDGKSNPVRNLLGPVAEAGFEMQQLG
ncbi:MAG TPA: VOC family protein, partial [Terriglobales bacterium]